jgi:hypothetical protein
MYLLSCNPGTLLQWSSTQFDLKAARSAVWTSHPWQSPGKRFSPWWNAHIVLVTPKKLL